MGRYHDERGGVNKALTFAPGGFNPVANLRHAPVGASLEIELRAACVSVGLAAVVFFIAVSLGAVWCCNEIPYGTSAVPPAGSASRRASSYACCLPPCAAKPN